MNIETLLSNCDILDVSVLILENQNGSWLVTKMNESAKNTKEVHEIKVALKHNIQHGQKLDINSMNANSFYDLRIDIREKSYKIRLKLLKPKICLAKIEKACELKDVDNKSSEISLFQTLLNYSPDLIYFKDREAKFIRNSKSLSDFLGVPQENLIGKTDLDVYIRSLANTKYQDDLNIVNTNIPIINKEEEAITINGKKKWLTSTKLPLKDHKNKVVGLFGISRDITEKKEAELKNKELNDNFQRLITASLGFQQTAKLDNLFRMAGCLIHKKFGGIQLVFLTKNNSKNNFDISFFPEKEMLDNCPCRTIIDYILSNSLFDEQVFENERTTIDLNDFFAKKAVKGFESFDFKYASVYQLKEKNELFGYILIFRNINFEEYDILFLKVLINQLTLAIERIILIEELKESIIKAEESDKLKTTFLNNISHEIRTPLNGVIGYAQLLLIKREPDIKDLQSYARNVIDNAKILLEVFEDILEISKIESGKISIIQQETNVNELIDSLGTYLEEQFKRHEKTNIDIEYSKELPDKDACFMLDSVRVFQILKPFVSNAVKFTACGHIKIGYKINKPSEIKFFIEDTGIGISEKSSEIIFKLFRQGDESATRKFGGIGVGLSIADALSKKLDGKISFETNPGKGSTFCFSMPIAKHT